MLYIKVKLTNTVKKFQVFHIKENLFFGEGTFQFASNQFVFYSPGKTESPILPPSQLEPLLTRTSPLFLCQDKGLPPPLQHPSRKLPFLFHPVLLNSTFKTSERKKFLHTQIVYKHIYWSAFYTFFLIYRHTYPPFISQIYVKHLNSVVTGPQ